MSDKRTRLTRDGPVFVSVSSFVPKVDWDETPFSELLDTRPGLTSGPLIAVTWDPQAPDPVEEAYQARLEALARAAGPHEVWLAISDDGLFLKGKARIVKEPDGFAFRLVKPLRRGLHGPLNPNRLPR